MIRSAGQCRRMMRGLGFVTVSLLIFTFILSGAGDTRAGQRRDFSNEHDFIRHFLGDDFSFITDKNNKSIIDRNPQDIQKDIVGENSSGTVGKLGTKSGRIDIHEHDHKEKGRHYHKNKHSHSHKSTGRHIHRHEHHHNHKQLSSHIVANARFGNVKGLGNWQYSNLHLVFQAKCLPSLQSKFIFF